MDRHAEQLAVEQVSAVRDAVGPDVDILVEVHRPLAPATAIRVARMMEPYAPFWFEEPVSVRDPWGGLLEAKRGITLPIVTGEEIYTKTEFHEVIARRAADILNPDVCNCGGILELREIAAMAEPHHIAIAPHNYNSTTVGLAATLQAAAGMPNFLITEYFVNFEALGQKIARPPLQVEDRSLRCPLRTASALTSTRTRWPDIPTGGARPGPSATRPTNEIRGWESRRSPPVLG
jgi:galactonate dehydratase